MYQQPPQSNQPLFTQEDMQRHQDKEHLNLLAIFYYVMAGFYGLGVLYGLLYAITGAAMIKLPTQPGRPGEAFPVMFFTVFGVAIMVISALCIWLNIATGNALKARKKSLLIQISAGISCLHVPIGTVLGVFTFLVLGRHSVKSLFDGYNYHPKEDPNNSLNR
jgi:hypothetical protein